jgi:hypothetical protein
MGGAYVSKGASTLVELARVIEETLDGYRERGLYLDQRITMIDRQHLEWEVEAQEKEPKEKQSMFLNNYKELLKNDTYDWFAFFHVHT